MQAHVPACSTDGPTVGRTQIVTALRGHGVGAELVAHLQRAVHCQAQRHTLCASRTRTSVVDGGVDAGGGQILRRHQKIGAPRLGPLHQLTLNLNACQIRQHGQGAVDVVGIEFGTTGLKRQDGVFNALGMHTFGTWAVHHHASEDGFIDLDGDHTIHDVLGGQLGLHHITRCTVMVGNQHRNSFQLSQVHRLPHHLGGQAVQHRVRVNTVAHPLELGHLESVAAAVPGLGHRGGHAVGQLVGLARAAVCWHALLQLPRIGQAVSPCHGAAQTRHGPTQHGCAERGLSACKVQGHGGSWKFVGLGL